MWDIKPKLIDRDNSMVVPRGNGNKGLLKGKGGQIYGDGI